MKAILRLPCRTTYVDYLAVEEASERRHEFLDGVIVAMAGGWIEHNAISGNIASLLAARAAAGCRYYTPDQRFWIAGPRHGRYGDGSIICGKPERVAHDDQAVTNPSIVIEVLSPTTEGDDEGAKREDFQSLASLQAYVLVAQDARRVLVYRRTERGTWRGAPDVYRDGDTFELPTLSRAIAVADVYDGVLDAGGRSLLR